MACYVSSAKIKAISDILSTDIPDKERVDSIVDSICQVIGFDHAAYTEYVERQREAAVEYRSKKKAATGTTYSQSAKQYYEANKAKLNAAKTVANRARRAASTV